jgi:hypothetical protein
MMAQLLICTMLALPVGEKLVYKVKYGPVTAGTLTLEVAGIEEVSGESCYHLVSRVVSNPSYSSLFFLNDMVESWCRVRDFVTLRTHKRVHEGNYRNEMTVVFDYESRSAEYSDETRFSVPGETRDMLSLWYYFRDIGLTPGDELLTWSHVDKKNYDVTVSVSDGEVVRTRAGEFDCIVVDMSSSGPAASGKIYLSDDDESLPVIIRTKMPLGYLSANLVSVDEGEQEE